MKRKHSRHIGLSLALYAASADDNTTKHLRLKPQMSTVITQTAGSTQTKVTMIASAQTW
jgi:hypothetical protein